VRNLFLFLVLASWVVSAGCGGGALLLPEPRDVLDRSLLDAVRANRLSDITDLLRRGANPDVVAAQQDGGDTPLVIAVREGYAEAVEILMSAGANVDVRDTGTFDGRTPLTWAAARGRADVMDILLRHGAAVNARSGITGTGPSALYWAVEGGHLDCVTLLLAYGATVGRRELEFSIQKGDVDIVERLFEAGADPWWRFSDTVDALELAHHAPEKARRALIATVERARRTPSRSAAQ
jgi:hypothetical protein